MVAPLPHAQLLRRSIVVGLSIARVLQQAELAVGQFVEYSVFWGKGQLPSKFTELGILDSLGRVHRVPKRNLSRIKKKYRQEFGRTSEADHSYLLTRFS